MTSVKMSRKRDADLIEDVSKGNVELVRAAIKDGADVDCVFGIDKDDHLFRAFWTTDKEVYLPILCLAVKNGSVAIIRELIQSGANVNLKGSKSGLCPVHVGARISDVVVQELINGGADVNIGDDKGNRPLHYTTEVGDVGILKALVAAGADINCRSKEGATAMWWTPVNLQYKRELDEFILALIHHGAVIDTGCDSGGSALLILSKFLHGTVYMRVIKEMIRCWDTICGSDKKALTDRLMELISNEEILEMFSDESHQGILSIPDESGRTIVQKIVGLGQHEALKRLVSYGVSVTATDPLGQTLLHSAMPIGNKETILVLIEAGCDYTALDCFERSVLHLAAFYGHCNLIELLTSKGLKPNHLDSSGRNSLHYAIMCRQDEAVRMLRQLGADCNQKDVHDMTPWDLLHPCEEACLTAHQFHGEVVLPVLALEGDKDFHLEVTNTPSLASVSQIPGIGSVNHIKDFNMNEFLQNVKDEIFAVVCKELPGLLNTEAVDLLGVGSSAEGSKVGIPNEVDFLIVSADMFPINSDDKMDGYCDMQSLWCTVSGIPISWSYSVWLWNLLMAKWSELQKEPPNRNGRFQIPFPPVRHPEHGTCVTWVWLYTDDVFKMLPVSIDLVMAFEYTSKYGRKTMPVTTWLKYKGDSISSYKVPKIPEKKYRKKHFVAEEFNCVGRISYPTIEVEHLVSLQERVKVVYITAKCLRMPEVCRFRIQDSEGDLYTVNDYVTSYHLKTVFLHLADMFLKSNLSLGRMVLMVYELLELCLEKKTLLMFFDAKVNVLAGSRLKISESLKVARVMTKFVRRLYERDFSAELHQDADEERRVKHLMPTWLAFETEGGDSSPPKKKPKTD